MTALALLVSLAAAADAAADAPAGEAALPPSVEAGDDADRRPGENRRVHFGVGYRAHVGLMESEATRFLVLQSELLGMMTVRVGEYDELRLQLGFAAGYPDTFAGESNLGFRWALGRRLSLGVGVLGLWGFWSLRVGTEVPLSLRLGNDRRHELTLALRVTTGVYHNNTFVWWDFKKQRFAIGADLAVGYSFIF